MNRRNVLNWFLCGLVFGSAIGLAVLTAVAAHAAVMAAGDFRAYPVFLTAIVIGGACYLFKRDGHPHRRPTSNYCFISRERKARIEDLL
jgi:hypothetical protein